MQPVQRIMRYPLLLTQITEKLLCISIDPNQIAEALEMVKTKAEKGDDLIAIDSIEELPFELSETGPYVKRENFMLLKPKRCVTTLFLFENLLVFTSNNSVCIIFYIHSK